MIRQGVVQEALTDFTGQLPHHLPQWSRINTLDKGRYPKAFLKDRLQPLPNPGPSSMEGRGRQDSQESEDRDLDLSDKMNPGLRVNHLEKSLNFLRSQHQEVLANLHDEIDKLKRQNKELNFRIVMLQKNGGSSIATSAKRSAKRSAQRDRHSTSGHQANRELSAQSIHRPEPPGVASVHSDVDVEPQEEKMDEIKLIFLEEEIKELKKALREEKNKNVYMTQTLEKHDQEKQTKQTELERVEAALNAARLKEAERQEEDHQNHPSGPLPFNASLNPLQVHLPAQVPRPPNMKECEIIIRHLQQQSDKQSHELNQLKCDLRDVLYSHKWTPDAYLLAKAYIADDDAREVAENDNLPKVALRQPNRKLPDIAYIQKDTVSLPALRQTVSNKAVERKKRTQILQKARLRREIETIQQ